MDELPNVGKWAPVAFAVVFTIELIIVYFRGAQGAFNIWDTTINMLLGGGRLLANSVTAAAGTFVIFWGYQHRLTDIGIGPVEALACVIAYDFIGYWRHRWSHQVRWFWANHVVHHSSHHLNTSTSLRGGWLQAASGLFVLTGALSFVGFHPSVVAFSIGVYLIYPFWVHTEAVRKMPDWFEYLFVTPSHHRVHHSSNPEHLDSNFASIFIIWDKLFGTFVKESDCGNIHYGVTGSVETFNPVRILFQEYYSLFRDAAQSHLTLGQRLSYVFGPPGWRHDGHIHREMTATRNSLRS